NDLGTGNNLDPQNPWFGGIFSLALGQEDSRDPRLSIAGALNRRDESLFKYLPDSVVVYKDDGRKSYPVPTPVTNFDGFLGGTFPNGNAIGAHIYIAHQDGAVEDSILDYKVNSGAFASILKFDVGVNWQLSTDVDGEFTGGIARVQYGPEDHKFFDSDLLSVFASGRLFSTWSLVNGEIVPAASYHFIQAPGIDEKELVAGMGVNVAMDRGFFWLGADYLYDMTRAHNYLTDSSTGVVIYADNGTSGQWDVKESWGGRISFGIERNIWWDWFVIRVGGSKVIKYVSCDKSSNTSTPSDLTADGYVSLCPEDGNYFYTNPSGDGTWDDNVGFGIGINVEEKLKIDFTMAEDMLYRNPFQGEGRLMSRISASYSF
ncbi:MAG TPA: hypothetical protein VLM37_09020, partial [Fibrobacteraceae bacterium]|nr:hypothetical protein [Fibrobacteraceae bacterium]